MGRSIGATDLRQRLTDVLQEVREEREAFFERLETMAAQNAERNAGMRDEEVLAIIEQARWDVVSQYTPRF